MVRHRVANLRNAFRWAEDCNQLDEAAQIATYAGVLGMALENQEPSTWAEELIEAACLGNHPRLGYLYVVSALCWMAGRIDDAIAYSDRRQEMVRTGRGEVPFGLDGLLGGTRMVIGELEKALEREDRISIPGLTPCDQQVEPSPPVGDGRSRWRGDGGRTGGAQRRRGDK